MKAFTGPTETLVLDDPSLPEVGISAANVEHAFHPSDDRMLVRLDPPIDRSRGGILVPDSSVPQSRSGVVVSVGLGALSDDGRTRMPMHAKPGQRVLFEFAAGYSIPRVPDATTTRERGYKVIRDGSIIAVIDGTGAWPEFVEPAEDVIPRLKLVQDWLLIRNDRPQGIHQLRMPTPAERAGRLLKGVGMADAELRMRKAREATMRELNAKVAANPRLAGRVLVLPTQGSQVHLAERWTGTVLARGPGLLGMIRCLDGDRVNRAATRCAVGDRVLYTTEFPLLSLPGVNGHALVREVPCLAGVLAGG